MKKMRPEPVGWPGAPFQGPNNMPEAGMPETAQKVNTFAAGGMLAPPPARRPPAPLTKDGFYCCCLAGSGPAFSFLAAHCGGPRAGAAGWGVAHGYQHVEGHTD